MKRNKFKIMILLFFIFFLSACAGNRRGDFVTGQYYHPDSREQQGDAAPAVTEMKETDVSVKVGTDLFLIMEHNMQMESLVLEQPASGKQYIYNYSIATRFLDKYGNQTTASYFDPGRCITIGEKDANGKVMEVRLSDQVWEYPGITKYSINEERGFFQIAGNKYSYDSDLFVHSDGVSMELSDLTDLDIIRAVGVDQTILSVSVTTGHGELQLTNTDLFDGSYIQIGDKTFSEITGEMTLEIPEGTYMVTVANNGYGGSTEVTIHRGQREVLDLETLKGEGPKYGNILFAVDVEGAVLRIDGEVRDYSQAIPLQYGIHTLSVTADTYKSYTKRLFVNSKEATIVVSLTGEDYTMPEDKHSENKDAGSKDSENNSLAGGLAGSQAGSQAGGKTDSTGSTSGDGVQSQDGKREEVEKIVDTLLSGDTGGDSTVDYLSTLSEFLSALDNKE